MKLKSSRTSSILMILCLSLVLSLGLLLGQFVFNGSTSYANAADHPAKHAASQETDLTGVTVKVKAKVSGANTKITWSEADGADYYKIWRSMAPDGAKEKLAGKLKKRTFMDQHAKSGQVYVYYVRGFNSSSRTAMCNSGEFTTVTRVYVETGHGTGTDGRWDSGCTWNGYQEAKLMIPIAKATCDHLKNNGIYVYTDAYDGNNRNLNYTLDFLDTHSVSAFLNIHCDAAFEDAGTLPLFRTKKQKKLAKALNNGVHEYVSIDDRGLEKRTDLTTLNSSKVHCPACLFETGNIKKDNKTLQKKTDEYGLGFAKGLCDYLGLPFTE